ncbi:hypothetical protein BO86DRAFT_61356 [Aspergillus japonicus CBS 114.51]|uniref:Uncharacterized protein n=1 Tax=Aspergillus japonicus CBS 114.51 TaxID=1448312 RepID=A0A8T8X4P2_ASPJA|nr:hypothetical protein BO86DRAFT_61356 [Aspergillus japonicus CBS 114.51]RAH83108.1 hypothetical protein BO86DRAFT_61356 [Aspergillus japonicus CBS 114.51]
MNMIDLFFFFFFFFLFFAFSVFDCKLRSRSVGEVLDNRCSFPQLTMARIPPKESYEVQEYCSSNRRCSRSFHACSHAPIHPPWLPALQSLDSTNTPDKTDYRPACHHS